MRIGEPDVNKTMDFIFNVARENWRNDAVQQACQDYVYFMKHHASGDAPSLAVDLVWHAHLQDSRRYEADVFNWRGCVVVHDPHPKAA